MTTQTISTGSPSALTERLVGMTPVGNASEALNLLEESADALQNLKTSLGLSALTKDEEYPLIENYDKFAVLTYTPIGVVAGSVFVTGIITELGAIGSTTGSVITPALTALVALCIPAIDGMVSYRGNPGERVKYLLSRLFSRKAKRKLSEAYEVEQHRAEALTLYKMIVAQVKDELHRLDVFTALNEENIAQEKSLKGMNDMGKLVSYYTVEQLEIEL